VIGAEVFPQALKLLLGPTSSELLEWRVHIREIGLSSVHLRDRFLQMGLENAKLD
jgi:hypothetical protein